MPRPLRKCYPDATYHCCSRCIERRDLLSSEYIKNVAVNVVNAALEKYDFKLIQIEFVENHLHIVIKTTKKGQTISRIMQYIKARIAEYFNRAYSRIGPFWNERFKSKIIEESDDPQSYFLHLMWYIAYNPVRKGIICDPRESRYGTIRSYLEEDFVPKVAITLHEYFINLGDTFAQRVNVFLEYENKYRMRFI
jgi:putative transposase